MHASRVSLGDTRILQVAGQMRRRFIDSVHSRSIRDHSCVPGLLMVGVDRNHLKPSPRSLDPAFLRAMRCDIARTAAIDQRHAFCRVIEANDRRRILVGLDVD